MRWRAAGRSGDGLGVIRLHDYHGIEVRISSRDDCPGQQARSEAISANLQHPRAIAGHVHSQDIWRPGRSIPERNAGHPVADAARCTRRQHSFVRDLGHRIIPRKWLWVQHLRKRSHDTAVTPADDIITHECNGKKTNPEPHCRSESFKQGSRSSGAHREDVKVFKRQELKEQEGRLIAAMKKVEAALSDDLHAQVTTVLVELTAYDVMRILHELQSERARVTFKG